MIVDLFRHTSECVESSGSVEDSEHRHGQQQSSLEERPRPLGEDISLTVSLPVEKSLVAGSPSSAASVVHRVFKVAFLGNSATVNSILHVYTLCFLIR